MPTAADLFRQLNELDEHDAIEAKRSSQFGRSVLETVCAFSNEPHMGGGHILLGVTEAENTLWPTFEVEGIQETDKIQSDIATACATTFNKPIRPRMSVELIGLKKVIVVLVNEVPAGDKPIHFAKEGLPRGAYRRIGPTDQRCTDDDLLLFTQERQPGTYDEETLPDADISDIDPVAVKQYKDLRATANRLAEELQWDTEELLLALCCAKRVKGKFRPTVAGILLFGRTASLRRLFPAMRVDYIRVRGTEWVRDPVRGFDAVEIRAPLVRAVLRAHAAILDDLPKAFRLPKGGVQREEIPVIPDRVIREALVNAVMHRSYREHGPIAIIRYSNRLEIRNPGYSLVAPERLGDPASQQRNPKLAAVFHDLHIAETKGSGIRVMRDAMKESGLSPPYLESDRAGNRFTAMLLFHHFLSGKDLKWLARFNDLDLTDGDAQALVFARETGAINNQAMRSLTNLDTLSASGRLRRLRDAGLLEMKGKGAETYYVPTPKLLGSSDLPEKPSELSPKSSDLSSESSEPNATPLPDEIQQLLHRMSRRPSKAVVQRAVLTLCNWKELKASELAFYLEKTANYLRQAYLSPLLDDELLDISTSKHHPDLRYRTSKKGIVWLKKKYP